MLRGVAICLYVTLRFMDKNYYIYVMSNPKRNVIYTGITSNLVRRVWGHKENTIEGFTGKYNVCDLIYYEIFDDPNLAIKKEKRIKSWSRRRKDNLIKTKNPTLKDLYPEIICW